MRKPLDDAIRCPFFRGSDNSQGYCTIYCALNTEYGCSIKLLALKTVKELKIKPDEA